MTNFGLKCQTSLATRVNKKLNVSLHVLSDVSKVSTTLDHQHPSLYQCRNTKSNRATRKSQVQLRVKLYPVDKLTEGING